MNQFFIIPAIYCYSSIFELLKLVVCFLNRMGFCPQKWHITERCLSAKNKKTHNRKNTIWIHAASLGEAKLVNKFFHMFEKRYPDQDFMLTAMSETGFACLSDNKTDRVCQVSYLPFDTISQMKRFIVNIGISRVWLIETEIWPSLLWVCMKKKVPVGIINARMEEKSFRVYQRFLFILRPLFKHMDTILSQNDIYSERFEKMGVSRQAIHAIGNIKSHIIIKKPKLQPRKKIRDIMNIHSDDCVVVVGCLHPNEALVIKNTIEIIQNKGYCWKWIIVPRHIEKSPLILEKMGTRTLHTKSLNIKENWSVCLIEAFGVMEDMYMIADGAIMGGTFNETGGHNIWEAVQFSTPVFWGPDYHTQEESYRQILEMGTGFCVKNEELLASILINTLDTEKEYYSSLCDRAGLLFNNKISSMESYLL